MKAPRIYTAPLPPDINGIAAPDGSDYIVLLNSRLPDLEKIKALLHELAHIANGDFNSSDSVQAIEARTHAAAEQASALLWNPWEKRTATT